MSSKRPSPLIGYNTSVAYRGVPYHVQTEDSGIDHPHVITHLFAEGGHILATRKTGYAQYVGTADYPDAVRNIIRAQHKEMIVALRDGRYDSILRARVVPATEVSGTTGVATVQMLTPAPEMAPSSQHAAPRSASAPRERRSSLAGTETSRDSLDEIIIANLVEQLEES